MNSLRLGIFGATAGVLLATALASGRTPTNYSAIKGIWVNSTSASLVKIVIGTDSTGRLFLHAYGACSPTPCDWGTVYRAVWSGSVGSATVKAVAATYGSSLTPISELLYVNLVGASFAAFLANMTRCCAPSMEHSPQACRAESSKAERRF